MNPSARLKSFNRLLIKQKMNNKKGQFYLVAAILIVLAISGIASVKTYTTIKSEPRKIQDIGSELREETTRIVDYGVYSKQNLTRLLNNFTDSEFAPYFLKKTENTNIVFIYGDADELYSVQYTPEYTGTIYATLGGVVSEWQTIGTYVNRTRITDDGDNLVTVTILNRNFDFEIKENEMFYFLITQEKDGEIYVERN
mgnify:CR=1 FL=1